MKRQFSFSIIHYSFLIIHFTILFSCSSKKIKPDLDAIAGIKFIEVRRAFESGYSFSEKGFQQNPEWILTFMKNDSAKIYSPWERKFIEYPMYYSHDSVYNFAREWLRFTKIGRDSLVLQLLQVQDKVIRKKISNVYMTFYSDSLLKARHLDAEKLKLPSKADTAYIQRLASRANRNPKNPDSAFSARKPVEFKSKNSNITVKKLEVKRSIVEDTRISDNYLYPEYVIEVKGAYATFVYPFKALVDDKGMIHYTQNLGMTMDPEGREASIKVIIKGYLQQYLDVTPGSTLGIRHTSEVRLTVKGLR